MSALPRSQDELVELRAKSVRLMKSWNVQDSLAPAVPLPEPEAEHPALRRLRDREFDFTCDGCEHAPKCEYAYDPYNTDGDCLDSK